MADQRPLITVITVTKDASKYIRRWLDGVVAADYPHNALEVIIVDGYSHDQTVDIIRSYQADYKFITVLPFEGKNTSEALNLALSSVNGEFVFLLNSAARVDQIWFSHAVAYFLAYSTVGLIQGLLLPENQMGDSDSNLIGNPLILAENTFFSRAAIVFRGSTLAKLTSFYDTTISEQIADIELGMKIFQTGFISAWLPEPSAYQSIVKKPFFHELYKAFEFRELPFLFVKYPRQRHFFLFKQYFLGSPRQLIELVLFPLTLVLALCGLLLMKRRLVFYSLYDMLVSASLIYGSIRSKEVVL